MKNIRVVTLISAIMSAFSSHMYYLKGDLDKWFLRFALGIILFALWGIMLHISKLIEKN